MAWQVRQDIMRSEENCIVGDIEIRLPTFKRGVLHVCREASTDARLRGTSNQDTTNHAHRVLQAMVKYAVTAAPVGTEGGEFQGPYQELTAPEHVLRYRLEYVFYVAGILLADIESLVDNMISHKDLRAIAERGLEWLEECSRAEMEDFQTYDTMSQEVLFRYWRLKARGAEKVCEMIAQKIQAWDGADSVAKDVSSDGSASCSKVRSSLGTAAVAAATAATSAKSAPASQTHSHASQVEETASIGLPSSTPTTKQSLAAPPRPAPMPPIVRGARTKYKRAGETFVRRVHSAVQNREDIPKYIKIVTRTHEYWDDDGELQSESYQCPQVVPPEKYLELAKYLVTKTPAVITKQLMCLLREEYAWRKLVDDWHSSLPENDPQRRHIETHRDFTNILLDTGRTLFPTLKAQNPVFSDYCSAVDKAVIQARKSIGLGEELDSFDEPGRVVRTPRP